MVRSQWRTPASMRDAQGELRRVKATFRRSAIAVLCPCRMRRDKNKREAEGKDHCSENKSRVHCWPPNIPISTLFYPIAGSSQRPLGPTAEDRLPPRRSRAHALFCGAGTSNRQRESAGPTWASSMDHAKVNEPEASASVESITPGHFSPKGASGRTSREVGGPDIRLPPRCSGPCLLG